MERQICLSSEKAFRYLHFRVTNIRYKFALSFYWKDISNFSSHDDIIRMYKLILFVILCNFYKILYICFTVSLSLSRSFHVGWNHFTYTTCVHFLLCFLFVLHTYVVKVLFLHLQQAHVYKIQELSVVFLFYKNKINVFLETRVSLLTIYKVCISWNDSCYL